MLTFIARRLAFGVVAVILIVAINFLLTRLAPGDPIAGLLGQYPAPPEYVASLRKTFGLDQSIWTQLTSYFGHVLTGDLGFSFANRSSVLEIILDRSRATLIIMIPALVMSSVLGCVLGVVAATRAGKPTDVAITAVVLTTDSVPVFWLAQMALLVLAVKLGLFPSQGMRSSYGGGLGDIINHAVLPVAVLTISFLASITRVTRIAVIDALRQDYIITARSKGISSRQVLVRHALRNSMIPVITVVCGEFGFILTSAILTETVFGWPGAGSLFVKAIDSRDYPVVQGMFLFSAVLVVAANLIADLLYGLFDPRIRRGYVRVKRP